VQVRVAQGSRQGISIPVHARLAELLVVEVLVALAACPPRDRYQSSRPRMYLYPSKQSEPAEEFYSRSNPRRTRDRVVRGAAVGPRRTVPRLGLGCRGQRHHPHAAMTAAR